jgi:hypothetical protein
LREFRRTGNDCGEVWEKLRLDTKMLYKDPGYISALDYFSPLSRLVNATPIHPASAHARGRPYGGDDRRNARGSIELVTAIGALLGPAAVPADCSRRLTKGT